jgi:hypothetical protein
MVPQSATHGGTGHAVVTRQVTHYTADHGTLNTTMGACADRQRSGTERQGKHQQNISHDQFLMPPAFPMPLS